MNLYVFQMDTIQAYPSTSVCTMQLKMLFLILLFHIELNKYVREISSSSTFLNSWHFVALVNQMIILILLLASVR